MLNNRAITWLTTSNAGSVRFEQSVGHQRGYINHLEVTVIQSCLQRLNQEISAQGEKYSIGIITPYRAQLELIRNRLKQIPLSHIEVDINTVDASRAVSVTSSSTPPSEAAISGVSDS